MKWSFHKTVITVVLLSLSVPCFSKKLIYGLDRAKTYNGKSTDVFVQAESFLSQQRAVHYNAFLQSNTSYPVKIKERARFHAVTIGPMPTALAVRTTANKIIIALKEEASTHHFAGHKSHSLHAAKHSKANALASCASQKNWLTKIGAAERSPAVHVCANIPGASVNQNPEMPAVKSIQEELITASANSHWVHQDTLFSSYSV